MIYVESGRGKLHVHEIGILELLDDKGLSRNR